MVIEESGLEKFEKENQNFRKRNFEKMIFICNMISFLKKKKLMDRATFVITLLSIERFLIVLLLLLNMIIGVP